MKTKILLFIISGAVAFSETESGFLRLREDLKEPTEIIKKTLRSDDSFFKFMQYGKYDESEYERSPLKFGASVFFWYGMKAFSDNKYKQAVIYFGAYSDQNPSEKAIGELAGGNAIICASDYNHAEVFYRCSLSTGNYDAIKGLIITLALQGKKLELKKQLDKVADYLGPEFKNPKKLSYIRILLPSLIYLEDKKGFSSLADHIGDSELASYKDLAINFARGSKLFGCKSVSRVSNILRIAGLDNENAQPNGPGILHMTPDWVQSNESMITTLIYDVNAVGWGDFYDHFPDVNNPNFIESTDFRDKALIDYVIGHWVANEERQDGSHHSLDLIYFPDGTFCRKVTEIKMNRSEEVILESQSGTWRAEGNLIIQTITEKYDFPLKSSEGQLPLKQNHRLLAINTLKPDTHLDFCRDTKNTQFLTRKK